MDNLFEVLFVLAGVAIFVWVMSGASERVTELLKKLMLSATKGKFPHGDFSWMLALVPAVGAIYGLNLDFLKEFKMFQDIDPELIKLLNAIILWVMSNWQHDKGVGKAVASKK